MREQLTTAAIEVVLDLANYIGSAEASTDQVLREVGATVQKEHA